MHAGFVLWGRSESDYRRPEGYRCLGTSCCVCRCLAPLSLTLSLAPGPSFSRNARSSALANPRRGMTMVCSAAIYSVSSASWWSRAGGCLSRRRRRRRGRPSAARTPAGRCAAALLRPM